MTLSIIAAIARDGSIGKDGVLPWPQLRQDMTWFKSITTAYAPYDVARHWIERGTRSYDGFVHTPLNVCIMGWRTQQSIGKSLPQRTSIVLLDTTYPDTGDWPCKARTFHEALENAARLNAENVFAIGGSRVFTYALQRPDCRTLYITEVDAEYPDADTWFPWTRMQWQDGILYDYDTRSKQQHWFARHHVSPWMQDAEGPKYRLTIWKRFS
jgi:dihydrofolate reductase